MDWGRARTSVETEHAGDAALASDPRDAAMVAEPESGSLIVIIERRPLIRECFVRCFKAASGDPVMALPSVESWGEIAGATPACVVLLCTETGPKDPEVQRQIAVLQAGRLPVILLAADEDLGSVMDALERGVRGYIPTSVPFEIALEAIRLVKVGGTFVPASSLLKSRQRVETPAVVDDAPSGEMFTARQAAVVEALRRGKANKIIAHELNMRESTVKVHVRNIMKKLKAKNRTEVAFMTNGRALAARPLYNDL